jgi:hypothetical protein
MKTLLTFIATCLLAIGAVAQEQYSATTLYSFAGTDTNVVGQTTNIAAAMTLTKFDSFFLEFRATGTNSAGTATGGFALAWQHSADGSNWGTVDTMSRHWFGIPTTNLITTVFTTNITVNSAGYWRLNWLTNNRAHCITNMSIKGWVKPRRQGSYP